MQPCQLPKYEVSYVEVGLTLSRGIRQLRGPPVNKFCVTSAHPGSAATIALRQLVRKLLTGSMHVSTSVGQMPLDAVESGECWRAWQQAVLTPALD